MNISMIVWLLGVIVAAGLLLIAVRFKRLSGTITEVSLAALITSAPFIFTAFSSLPLVVLAVALHAWLVILPARLLLGRLEPEFLKTSTWQNVLLGAAFSLVLALSQIWQTHYLAKLMVILWLFISVGAGVYFLGQLWWNTRRYKIPALLQQPPLKDLPTVSVCIPARNEDHALADCLNLVLASDYPKLEVLVLDDCSQDATSDIIKTFAHGGVRFIQGAVPASGWLGKNQALNTLAQQASGDYLLFMDADTHVGPQSISCAINYTLTQGLQMVSVLPQNRLGPQPATIFKTLMFFWRLITPITPRHVPVSSSCWLISAARLKQLGGFTSVSRKIVPEESFACRIAETNKYRFVVSDTALNITTAKRWSSQIETSLRLTYPQMKRQPLYVFAAVAVLVGLGLAPFVVAGIRLFQVDFDVVFWLAVAACAVLLGNYYAVLVRVQPKSWLLAGLCWPIVATQEALLFTASMLQYEFSEVNWKGRNVCYPVVAPRPPARRQ